VTSFFSFAFDIKNPPKSIDILLFYIIKKIIAAGDTSLLTPHSSLKTEREIKKQANLKVCPLFTQFTLRIR